MKVVFDTNIYISALITKAGNGEKAYLKIVYSDANLYTSVPILTELGQKLQTKFHWSNDQIINAIRNIKRIATIIKPEKYLQVLAYDPDNRILECAILAQADYIVTGDKHLLNLVEYEGVKILKLANWLEKP